MVEPGQRLTVGWCRNTHLTALYVGKAHSTEFPCARATKTPAPSNQRFAFGTFGLIPGFVARRMEVCFEPELPDFCVAAKVRFREMGSLFR